MRMFDAGAVELAAVRDRFDAVVSEWGLAPREVGAILGLPSCPGMEKVDDALGVDAETRMRLVIEVASLLHALLGGALLDWLRDEEGDDVTPLTFMSRGVVELRAMRAAAFSRL